MHRSPLRAQLGTGLLCAGLLYGSALFVAACSDADSSTAPRRTTAVHGLRRDAACYYADECTCNPDEMQGVKPSPDGTGTIGGVRPSDACGSDGSGGGGGGDYIDDGGDDSSGPCASNETHLCSESNFNSTQQAMVDSMPQHISQQCRWVMSYLNSLSQGTPNGGNFASTSFFGVANNNWPPNTPDGRPTTADTHHANNLGNGPDYYARVHIRPTTFSDMRTLTRAAIHEAAHGYFGIDDPTTGAYDAPGTPEGWANACYVP